MKITVIGTGYVGLVSGVCFADLGNIVTCVDKDAGKIEMLDQGEIPIYEPGLKELVSKNKAEGRLSFSTNTAASVEHAELVILAVGTPQLANGEANLQYIEEAAREIAVAMNGYKMIVTKSTVPVGTNERVKAWIASLTEHSFDVVSVPEFLREGTAIRDTFFPDRIVIGAECSMAAEKVAGLHKSLTANILFTDIRSAEMIKYASNAFLATKISFINEIANICEKVGADVTLVAKGMGYDQRIGASFLNAGIGYGGSCFPKDTRALIQIAGNVEYDFKLLRSVVEVNQQQRFQLIRKLFDSLGYLSGRTIGVWGLAFKPNTDDVREAPSLEIVPSLIGHGAKIKVYDPIAMEKFRKEYNHASIVWCSSALEAAEQADALCLLTEWSEFAEADLVQIEQVMKQPILVDGRNVFTPAQIEKTNLSYYSAGRPAMNKAHAHAHEHEHEQIKV